MKQFGHFVALAVAGFFGSAFFAVILFFISVMPLDGTLCGPSWHCALSKGLGRLALILGFGSPIFGVAFGAVIYALNQRAPKRPPRQDRR